MKTSLVTALLFAISLELVDAAVTTTSSGGCSESQQQELENCFQTFNEALNNKDGNYQQKCQEAPEFLDDCTWDLRDCFQITRLNDMMKDARKLQSDSCTPSGAGRMTFPVMSFTFSLIGILVLWFQQ